MSSPRTSRKLAPKQDEIIQDLRRRIVSGELAPGSQLPPRRELEERFQAGVVTVQRALDKLIRDGFVYAKATAGTYVSATPPHLSRYALLFAFRPTAANGWNAFWTALYNEAVSMERSQPRHLPVYYEIEGEPHGDDSKKLLRDMAAERVAGLIFTFPPYALKTMPVMTREGIPRVVIAPPGSNLGMPTVHLDEHSFITKALDYLAGRGRRRIAVLLTSRREEFTAELLSAMNARQMSTRPYWLQIISPRATEGARTYLQLLLSPGQAERPDGLIISDDNLTDQATAGLLSAGVDVPRDLDVVTHCNYPCRTSGTLSLKRLGYDARQVLEACIRGIDLQRQGHAEASQLVSAMFEDELPAPHPA